MKDKLRGKHIWIGSGDWEKFKNAIKEMVNKELLLDGFEVIMFSSDENKDNLAGKRIDLKK